MLYETFSFIDTIEVGGFDTRTTWLLGYDLCQLNYELNKYVKKI